MKNSVRIAGAVLFALTSGACQSTSGALKSLVTPSSLNDALGTSALAGATWRLAEISGAKALAGVAVTATFGAANSLSGSGGCNRYFGTATTADGKLSVGPLGSTRMFCAEGGVSDQENAFFTALAKATSYSVIGTELRLHTASGDAVLVFVRE